jgi:hypothetical protein
LLQMFELGRHTNSAFSLPSPQHAAFTSTNPEKEIEKSFTIHCHLTHPIKHGQSDTVHETDTDTSIPIIISVGVGHDTCSTRDTANMRSVRDS